MKRFRFYSVLVLLVIILILANETIISAVVQPAGKVSEDTKFNETAILSWFGNPDTISTSHKGNISLKTYKIGAFQLLISQSDNKVEQMEIIMQSAKSSPNNELFFSLYVVTVTKKVLNEEDSEKVNTTLASGNLWEKNPSICRGKYCFKRVFDQNSDVLKLIVNPDTSGGN